VQEYRIRGADGLRRALEESFGAMLAHRDELKKANNSGSASQFMSILKQVNSLLTVGLKIKQLFGPVVDEILQLPGPTE
jgi:hypothetical protein